MLYYFIRYTTKLLLCPLNLNNIIYHEFLMDCCSIMSTLCTMSLLYHSHTCLYTGMLPLYHRLFDKLFGFVIHEKMIDLISRCRERLIRTWRTFKYIIMLEIKFHDFLVSVKMNERGPSTFIDWAIKIVSTCRDSRFVTLWCKGW